MESNNLRRSVDGGVRRSSGLRCHWQRCIVAQRQQRRVQHPLVRVALDLLVEQRHVAPVHGDHFGGRKDAVFEPECALEHVALVERWRRHRVSPAALGVVLP